MSALIIVGFTTKNTENLKQYGALVPDTLAKFGGEIIAKGPAEKLHGNFKYETQVVIGFQSREDAAAWYHSDNYQALAKVRDQGMDSQFQLIG
tara:strand:- start:175 stop:453 length:279 start_codon:yes stop_codon:yes gene_type:complete